MRPLKTCSSRASMTPTGLHVHTNSHTDINTHKLHSDHQLTTHPPQFHPPIQHTHQKGLHRRQLWHLLRLHLPGLLFRHLLLAIRLVWLHHRPLRRRVPDPIRNLHLRCSTNDECGADNEPGSEQGVDGWDVWRGERVDVQGVGVWELLLAVWVVWEYEWALWDGV